MVDKGVQVKRSVARLDDGVGGWRWWLLPAVWAVLLALAGSSLVARSPAAVFGLTLLLSAPALACLLYLLTARKIHRLAGVTPGGWWHRLFGGRVLGTLFWCLVTPLSTAFVLLQFHGWTLVEWASYAAVVPLFLLCCLLLRRLTRGELRPYRQTAETLRLARLITPTVIVLVYLLLLPLIGAPAAVASLHDAVALRQAALETPLPSALVEQALVVLTHYEGARLLVASQLGAPGTLLPTLLLALGTWLVFFNITLMFGAFVIPAREYRRLFSRLDDADMPDRPAFGRVVATAAIAVLVVGFVALPGMATLESRADQSRTAVAESVATAVVLIDGLPYSPAVLDEHRRLRAALYAQLDAIAPRLQAAAELGFDRLEDNVEGFLDWYYGLTAEYLRTWRLLQGDLEGLLAERLREHLQRDDPFADFELALGDALREVETLQAAFTAETTALLAGQRLDSVPTERWLVLSEYKMEALLLVPTVDEQIPLATRLGAGGTTGAVTSLAAGKIVANVSASGAIKLAAQPLAKAALPRLALVAAGAAAGAGAGSVVPGAGTLVGAAIGTATGLVVGVGADYGLLKLEERLGRDALRDQLLAGIAATRAEFFSP